MLDMSKQHLVCLLVPSLHYGINRICNSFQVSFFLSSIQCFCCARSELWDTNVKWAWALTQFRTRITQISQKHAQCLLDQIGRKIPTMKLTALLFILITSTVCVTCFEPFDDKIRFDVNWAGPVSLREGQLTMVRASYLRRCLCLRFYLKVYCASTSSWPICALSNWLIVFRFLRKNQTFPILGIKKTYKWHFRIFF